MSAPERIGIRPQICYRMPELGAGPGARLRHQVNFDPSLSVACAMGRAGGASICATHRSFGNATSHQQPLATKTGLHDSVPCAHAVADLGSDPNSARQFSICHKRIPELGSDPNSAGQHRHAACPRRISSFGSSPYAACAARYKINSKIDLRRICFHGESATSLRCTDRSAVRVARRIGV